MSFTQTHSVVIGIKPFLGGKVLDWINWITTIIYLQII